MGMYDSIECKCFLPMPDEPKGYTGSHGFQTKDFDCSLDIYIIILLIFLFGDQQIS